MSVYFWIYQGEKIHISSELAIDLHDKGMQAVCICDKQMLVEADSLELTFEALLFDERYTQNGLLIEEGLLQRVGGINRRITAKQEYELALRVSQEASLWAMTSEEWISSKILSDKNANHTYTVEEGFVTDAYIVSRYFNVLQEKGLAEPILAAILEEAEACPNPEATKQQLNDMLKKDESYWRIYRGTQPILIYLGVTYCYNILNVFAKELANALEALGERIVYYDTEKDDVTKMSNLVKQQFKASIGFQTWAMSVRMGEKKIYLQDMIGGPKYNFIVDHPVWLKEQLQSVPNNYYILTHDRDYQDFIQRYFPKVKGVYLLPPGGRMPTSQNECVEKANGISFLGTYGDYRKKLSDISICVPRVRHLASRYLGVMKKRPELTAEEAFKEAASAYGIKLDEAEFLELFHEMKSVIQAIMYYYREKVVACILQAGLELHVYGESWKQSPFCTHEKLFIHDAVNAEQGIEVLQKSKISLNVMAWHKDGFTERIADSMLAGSVVVSDWSRQLEEKYAEEIVLYRLDQLKQLPELLNELLQQEEKRNEIAHKAEVRARMHATWAVRAKEFLEKVEEAEMI